ncbi:hypothetical protein [Helicobacter cinaedi]|uniref:hypothetical protein n=1 Tax=Helicobacter cinaedi TaxID=213 RepID=UPI0003068FBB|nr:hypothetical protein [Helicobacter cinaedi]
MSASYFFFKGEGFEFASVDLLRYTRNHPSPLKIPHPMTLSRLCFALTLILCVAKSCFATA